MAGEVINSKPFIKTDQVVILICAYVAYAGLKINSPLSLKSVELLFPWRKFAKKKKKWEGVITFREKKVKNRTVVVNKSSWVSKLSPLIRLILIFCNFFNSHGPSL